MTILKTCKRIVTIYEQKIFTNKMQSMTKADLDEAIKEARK